MLTRLLINREYAKLWAGGAVSLLGDAIFDTTLVLWVGTVIAKGQTWAPLAVAGVLLAISLPGILLAPLAGVFVDRWNYRRTMLSADLIRAVLIAVLFPLPLLAGSLSTTSQLIIVYAVVLAASSVSQFFSPARFAIIGDLVGDEQRPKASSIAQATNSLALIIGPPLAAPLLFTVGIQWALLINVVSFLVSFLAVRAVRAPASGNAGSAGPESPDLWREFRAGLRFFAGNRVLVAVLGTAALVQFGAGCLGALGVFFVPANLHVAARWFGTLDAALGVGSMLGALAAGLFARRVGYSRVYALCLMLGGIGFAAYARSSDIWVALLLIFLAGIPIAGVNSVVGLIVLRVTPRALIGRVISVLNPTLQVTTMLSVAIAGWLASTVLHGWTGHLVGLTFGPYDTIIFSGGLVVFLGGFWALFALRGADQAPPAEPDGTAAIDVPDQRGPESLTPRPA